MQEYRALRDMSQKDFYTHLIRLSPQQAAYQTALRNDPQVIGNIIFNNLSSENQGTHYKLE